MKGFICFALLLISSLPAMAQQTIFNVPSADVTENKKTFLQHESQFRAKDPDQFVNTTNYFARGIGYNTEIDATLFNLGSPASKNTSLGLGFKSVFLLSSQEFAKYQPKITVGSMVPFSLQGNGIGNWTYASSSILIPQTGTRLTGGISLGSKQIFGESANCFIGGFEQEITEKFSFLSDWYSGNHVMGIWANGFSYKLPQNFVLFGGYQIPNSKKVGRNSFVVELAVIF